MPSPSKPMPSQRVRGRNGDGDMNVTIVDGFMVDMNVAIVNGLMDVYGGHECNYS